MVSLSTRDITSHHIYGTEIQQIVNKMKELSEEIQDKANEIGLENKPALRKDPEIVSLWRKLCVLHMRGLVFCDEQGFSDSSCAYIREPQVCQKVLGIPREETCCGRFFGIEPPEN